MSNRFPTEQLNERLVKAIEKLGFDEATQVQAQAIPRALAGKDLVVSAETGSGKTAAFLLPTLQQLLDRPNPKAGTQALVLVPTRELARQVVKQCKELLSFTHLKVGMITGGDEFKYQKAMLRKNPELLVATPGRLLEHLSQKTPDFDDLEVLILDEADRMLDMGFQEDVLKIIEACRQQRQTLLFSATLGHKGVAAITEQILTEPESIILDTARHDHANISQEFVLADDVDHKKKLLARLLDSDDYKKVLVFCNTKVQVDQLGALLRYQDRRVGVLHGDMEQDERNLVMNHFRHDRFDILVASDVASRGLDIKNIDLVINFDMARNADDYVHRIGRTGRAGEQGTAISFIASRDWNLKATIERFLRVIFTHRRVAGLEGKYKGPEKVKTSGKAAGTKKRKPTDKKGGKNSNDKKDGKTKQRLRDQKNVGKRRKPSEKPSPVENSTVKELGDGFAPFKKKT